MPTNCGTVRFLGIEFAITTYEQMASELARLSESRSFSYIVTPNVDHVVTLHEGEDESVSKRFREAYDAAAFRLCDSRILQLMARIRGITLDVVTGSDLTAYLFKTGYFNGKRVAIIGGDETMLQELRHRFPAIKLVQHIPPMGVLRNPKAAADIEAFIAANPSHCVLFAIGAPQSEIIAHQCLLEGRSRGVALCVGASIDFVLGRKARAPAWMQQARLEWAYRVLSEPRRLWKRYFLDGPKILKIIERHSLGDGGKA
jgi:N-acetylglucosaminyldiphosphoundecaprenol N-acetyl-beta-D-mannosaminyltransferase